MKILIVSLVLAFVASGLKGEQRIVADLVFIAVLIIMLPIGCHAVLALLYPIIARFGFQPKKAPKAYVEALFDGYAKRFDQSLFIDLAYIGPNLVRRIVAEHVPQVERSLIVGDLGCGTGACGPLFRRLASELVGIDLSSGMLAQAKTCDAYDRLHQDDLITFLKRQNARFDLLIAADVFVYIGDLTPALQAAKQALSPGGWFAFTVEHEVNTRYRLDKSGRYKHAPGYIETLAAAVGLTLIDRKNVEMRLERGRPVNADVWLLQRPPPHPT